MPTASQCCRDLQTFQSSVTPLEVAWNVLVKDKLDIDLRMVTWHVANVTNLIISTESLTGANIEVTHAKNESSMIMDRSGTRTSVVLHKFAKVPWFK